MDPCCSRPQCQSQNLGKTLQNLKPAPEKTGRLNFHGCWSSAWASLLLQGQGEGSGWGICPHPSPQPDLCAPEQRTLLPAPGTALAPGCSGNISSHHRIPLHSLPGLPGNPQQAHKDVQRTSICLIIPRLEPLSPRWPSQGLFCLLVPKQRSSS